MPCSTSPRSASSGAAALSALLRVELEAMQAEVRTAMEEGALGVGSSLIYAPAFYAKTPELVALMKAAAPFGGMYISHMRSEGNRLVEAATLLEA